MPRRRGSGRQGPALDVSALARALAIPGGDLRHWVSYGSVAAIVDEDGNADTSDPNAVVITPAGVEVDVVLEPSNYPVTCRHGISAGTVFVCSPIKVGDQVVVGFPEGDVSMVPEILKIIPGGSAPIPTAEDGKPIFQNDRLLVYAKGVPVDLRTDGGAQAILNADGSVAITAGNGKNINLNGGSSGVARIGDSTRRTLSSKDIQNIMTSAIAAGLVTAGGGGPPPQPVALNEDGTGIAEIAEGSGTVLAGD